MEDRVRSKIYTLSGYIYGFADLSGLLIIDLGRIADKLPYVFSFTRNPKPVIR
jgi:hypothetical protein